VNDICLLIVEDEQRLAEVLKRHLKEAGFEVDIASDGYLGKELAKKNKYQLIILDINLPLINGYDLCKEIRKTNQQIPIIMLSALSTFDNKLAGFEVGADDFVTKPFDIRELIARINVFLKRTDTITTVEKLTIADLELDLNTKAVTRSHKRIELTHRESKLLEVFLKNKGKLLSREFILEHVWGLGYEPNTNIIDVYVNYLRKKIDKHFEPKLIHTKFGFGFYCNEEEL